MSIKEYNNMLLFNKWDSRKIDVNDLGLQRVISLSPSVIPVTFGRHESYYFFHVNRTISIRKELYSVLGLSKQLATLNA